MTCYSILRLKKLKGSSLSSSDSHGGRTRDTPNADPERRELNELLLGEDRDLREMLEERVREEGLWRRANSVEVVEIMVTATRAHFEDERGELVEERVREWERANVEWLREKYGDLLLKLKSHRDERTPHLTGYFIPVVDGGLNARALIGNRGKLSKLQDEYGEAMKPLGLERGVKGSRAKHEDIGRFYGTIMRPVALEIDRERIALPARLELVTEGGREAYRDRVINATLKQVEEQIEPLRNQALLTLEETSKREAAEKRATERIAAAERTTAVAVSRYEAEFRENEELRGRLDRLGQAVTTLRSELAGGHLEKKELSKVADELKDRLRDIPMPDVMEKLGYGREQVRDAFVYRTAQGQIEYFIRDNQLHDAQQMVLCRNSVDLVMHMKNVDQDESITRTEAVHWLAEQFGASRALAAYVVWCESNAREHLEITRPEREERMRPPLVIQQAEPERLHPAQQRDDDSRTDYGYSR